MTPRTPLGRGRATAAAALAIVALAVTAVAIALTRSPATESATTSPLPSVAVMSSPSATVSATARASVASTAVPVAPSRGFMSTKYGYVVTLPDPYRVSTALTKESPPIQCCGGEISKRQAAQRDVFTAFTPADEQAALAGQDCERSCSAWNGTAIVYVFTDAGSMTPHQWIEAGNGPGSPGPATDVILSGQPAVQIAPAGRYEVMYIVADGKGRMFHVAYELFHIAAPPPGVSREKLDQLILSFGFV